MRINFLIGLSVNIKGPSKYTRKWYKGFVAPPRMGFIVKVLYILGLSVKYRRLGGENGQFRHNRASNA
jgi:hypothetical protein